MTAFAARDYHDLAIKSDGSVWAWGSGGNGELGDNIFADSNVPVQVIFSSPTFTPTNWIYLPLLVR